ncbi:fumarylacetoacetate hydrolase family protein [Sinomonas sp. G460-2]|uniref:fumarylacetoacetate hydrolase family protein n=1 Tax=Sinomonas sp. G460-2 TaxID=3393464 RepID=UPI0039EE6412
MRIANLDGRTVLSLGNDRWFDVYSASDGVFGPDPADILNRWEEFVEWAAAAAPGREVPIDPAGLGAPSPAPKQIFAVGLNYRDHAAESGFEAPESLPPVFPKFLSSLTGPNTTVVLPEGGKTDWEAELAVVIGREAHNVAADEAWSHVAGVMIAQDISERVLQLSGPAPQFGLGKSFPGFTPTGPWLVTPDELADPDNLGIECWLDGEQVQNARTSQLIFPVAGLIAGLSRIVTLFPGDIVLTGTPAGVGLGRDPQRWIRPGQTLVTRIEGLGELRQDFTDAAAAGHTLGATVAATSQN